jgi:quinol monooxygenase YgiN
MSPPALIGFAGVLVAAVATGVLAGRCVRQPRIGFILWTVASLALTVALAAQSMGFASGFSATTFRAVQLFALLLAPLWLAWGLVELVAWNEAARFGMRLISAALTVVASVILVTDPLNPVPFSKSWPSAGPYFQPVAHYALDVAQLVAVAALVTAGLRAARAGQDPRWRPALPGVAAVGLAVLLAAGLRLSWPDRSVYPLLSLLAAALVMFGASRTERVPSGGSGVSDDSGADHARRLVGDYEAGVPGGKYATYGYQGPRDPSRPPGPGGPQGRRASPGPMPRPPQWPQGRSAPPGVRVAQAPGPEAAAMAGEDTEFGTDSNEAGSPGAAPARPHGRILIFTLLDDRAADFDRLAEQTAEEVRVGEPDTLVYVIHLVPNAPLQRIFYEIYRDRAAFDRHESQPYMKRFVADRRSCVLATNVIELTLKYAKVAPLPNPQPSSAAAPSRPRAQLPPGPPPRRPGTQRLEHLPRTQRPDQPPRPTRRNGGT